MAYRDIERVLTDENIRWKSNTERSPLKSNKVINDLSKIVQEEGGEKLPKDSGILRTRFEVFRFVASQNKGCNLDDSEKKKAFESDLKTALGGDTLQATWPPKDGSEQDEPVAVKGRVLRIYNQPEVAPDPVGYIRTSDGSIVKFGQEHFVAEFPLPLRAGDEVSYLVNRKTSSLLEASIRVTTYHHKKPIDSESANKFLLYVKGADKDLGCLFRAHQYQSFFTRILSDDQLLLDQNSTIAKEIIQLSASSIVIQFPIESEREKEYNQVFKDEGSSVRVDRSEQKKFLRMFSRCSLFGCISQSDDLDEESLLKAFKLILALLRDFPDEREHICDAIISLASKLSPEKSVKVWNLVFFTVSRPSADVYAQSWRNIPEMMSLEEFQSRLETRASGKDHRPMLEVVKPTYSSREEYFNTYYKLLREDTYRMLCSTIYRFIHKQPNQEKDAIYDIEFRRVEISHTGGSCCRVRYTPRTDAVKQEGKENSSFLRSGNLFCILIHSGDFWSHKKGDVLFAVKEMEDWHAERDSNYLMRSTILLRFLPFGGRSEVEAIEWLRFSKNTVMIESPVFFRAYEPVLQALQTMDTRCLPFESELLRRERGEFDGEYLTPDTKVNIGPFLESTKVEKCPIGQVRERLSERKECVLDEKQLDAVECIVKNRLAIVQGPPGTGKSFIAAKVIESLLSLNKTPIVIMAYKNRALDHLLNACYKFSKGGIVRLGKLSEDYADGHLRECLLREQMKRSPQCYSVNDPLERKLNVLQKSIKKAWKKLQKASGDDQKFDLTDCWGLLEDDEDREKLLSHLVGVGDLKRALENKDSKERKRAESKFQEIIKSSWGKAAQFSRSKSVIAQQAPSDHIQRSDSSDVSSDVVEGDETGEEIEKERNLDCEEDYEFPETGSITMDVLGSTPLQLIASNSVEETEKELKDMLAHSKGIGNEENRPEFCRKFYYYLAAKRYKAAKTELEALLKEFSTVRNELAKLGLPPKISLLRKAKIVAMTTTKAAIEHQLLNMLQPQIIVIEEGGGVLEPNLLACLTPNIKHLIMIGDNKQIGPKVVSEKLHRKHYFGVSLLERLADPSKVAQGDVPEFPHITLDTQSRMNPELLDLFQKDYGEGFQLKTREKSLQSFQPPACMKKCKVWWTYKKGMERQRNGKVYNETEAKMAASYCYWLFSEGFGPKDVALLTPYSAQVQEITDAIKEIVRTGQLPNEFKKFLQRVFTVDSFQGHESDIVILSLVRKNNKSRIGFLSDETRQVVALSRQRRALCIIGCQQHMEDKSLSWKKRLTAFGRVNIQESLQVIMGGECIEVSAANELKKLVTERLSNRGRTAETRYLPSPDEERATLRQQVCDHRLEHNKSSRLLQRIAEIMGADWKAVIRKAANMSEGDIKKIEANNPKSVVEQGFQALDEWLEKSESSPSVGQLLDGMPEQMQRKVVEEVQNVLYIVKYGGSGSSISAIEDTNEDVRPPPFAHFGGRSVFEVVTQQERESPNELPKDEPCLGNELDLPSLKNQVVPTVAAKMKQFGIFLGVENVVVDKVKVNYPMDCERACEEMLKLWLARDYDTGKNPRTWATVIVAMEMAEFKEQAQALRDQLLK